LSVLRNLQSFFCGEFSIGQENYTKKLSTHPERWGVEEKYILLLWFYPENFGGLNEN
jgi:hypothetical protein